MKFSRELSENILNEKAPEGMEPWVKKNKKRFKEKYGDKWASYLYGTAWKMHNNESSDELEEDLNISGANSGSIKTPMSQRKIHNDNEIDEEQVHPDDKIGQMMLKKTKTPSYFKSNKKKQTVSQKKVSESFYPRLF